MIVRSDLPLGVLAAQVVHAAGETGPVELGAHAVVLGVATEAELLTVQQTLLAKDIQHLLVREPDLPWAGAAMAIGINPVQDRRAVRSALGNLRLLK